MKNIARIILIGITVAGLEVSAQSDLDPAGITPDDIQMLLGNWEGSLTYMDYNTNEPFSMPANLMIKQGKDAYKLVLANSYPNEPKANSTGKLTISKDGMLLNKKHVRSKMLLENGDQMITTEYAGKDGNDHEKATIRSTYILGAENFIIRKEVQFEGATSWIKRNEYNYRRVNNSTN